MEISRSTAKLLEDGAARDAARDAKTEAHRQRQMQIQAQRHEAADAQVFRNIKIQYLLQIYAPFLPWLARRVDLEVDLSSPSINYGAA